ncbi:response regulator [Phyllobacterium endophyticum]|uniref:DNA-binding response regulator n=1 Tax=Phyllobacterium endophyticum TaxID=1149773 RepID=A0A2P7AME3_9HYPH|nr:response regulator transcription factor [Phyllobacterium endophyticum]MBB3238411.1 DNA-binding NarL/FixJ family response regulator [Phyllobacterium endophyticum]PSH55371.1 DNA-binding response regulator [Phyllobacterium endophyticum]TXR48781.1 response regulator transcription factor [Phyllobacterium endophyticum]TYR40098.1 response regulator transcription factor [Phyllobacterium endophyticum]
MTRILIADDHEIVRQGVKAILSKRERWEVVGEAANGRDAVEQARATQPEIAILDYALPFINGVEAARQIRLHSPKTEVLIFTQHDNEALLRNILEAGVRGYLLKTDATQYLVQAVEALEHRQPFFTKTVSDMLVSSYLAKTDSSPSILTSRETSVVKLIAEGHSNKETAAVLGLSEKTVETHRAAAMRKLDAKSTAALVRYAIRNRLIEA